jgi:serine/threonine protein kinase
VLSQPGITHESTYVQASLHAQELLREKKIPREFIHQVLAYNSAGFHLSEFTPHRDLLSFFCKRPNDFCFEEIKRFVAQILLGAADLHTNNLAHQNISVSRILVYSREGKYFLKIACLSSIIETNNAGQPLNSNSINSPTKDLIAPEYRIATDKRNLDYKMLDCYNIGHLLLYIAFHALKIEEREKLISTTDYNDTQSVINNLSAPDTAQQYYFDLMSVLCNSNVADRCSIVLALQSKLFGETKEARDFYFATLRNEASYNLVIDNFIFNPPKINESFYLLDSKIKIVIALAGRLETNLLECETNLAKSCDEFPAARNAFNAARADGRSMLSKVMLLSDDLMQQPILQDQIQFIISNINWEMKRIEDFFNATFKRHLTVIIEQTFKIYRRAVIELMNYNLMFATNLREDKAIASNLAVTLDRSLSNSLEPKKFLQVIYMELVIDKTATTYKQMLKDNIEKLLGKPFEEYATEVGIEIAIQQPAQLLSAPPGMQR